MRFRKRRKWTIVVTALNTLFLICFFTGAAHCCSLRNAAENRDSSLIYDKLNKSGGGDPGQFQQNNLGPRQFGGRGGRGGGRGRGGGGGHGGGGHGGRGRGGGGRGGGGGG